MVIKTVFIDLSKTPLRKDYRNLILAAANRLHKSVTENYTRKYNEQLRRIAENTHRKL